MIVDILDGDSSRSCFVSSRPMPRDVPVMRYVDIVVDCGSVVDGTNRLGKWLR